MKFIDILNDLCNRQNELESLNESNIPHVGIFYVCDNNIEVQSLPLPLGKIKNQRLMVKQIDDILKPLGFYTLYSDNDSKVYVGYNGLHINMFNTMIKRLYQNIKKWTDVPRGRVFYNLTDDKFECIMDKCLDTTEMKSRLNKEFNVSLNFSFNDENYTCKNCNE